MKPSITGILLVIGFLGFCQVTQGAAYTFTTIDAPGSNGSIAGYETSPNGINDLGEIVGSYHSSNDNSFHGFLYNNGLFSNIDAPGGGSTFLSSINDTGEIVGQSQAFGQFLYANGNFTRLNLPASSLGFHLAINDSGEIAGTFLNSIGDQTGFLYDQGTISTVIPPGSTETFVFGINNHGQIAGGFLDSLGSFLFVDTNGVFSTIRAPGLISIGGINDAGDIVVCCSPSFLYTNGAFTTINVPDARGTDLLAINDLGQIVGTFADSNGISHGFLATPTPEPASLLLFAWGLAGIIILILRRRMTRTPNQ